jgi:tripartite-type tricarboxylate transporter receptor subunit TctC
MNPTRNVPKKIFQALLIAMPLLGSLPSLAQADRFPSRPVTMVVPFTPAGPTDALARVFAGSLQEELGQPIIIENKPGAAGNLGSSAVARATPDGYTLLFASSGPLLINASLFKDPGFNARTDFTPLAYIGELPNVLVVESKQGAKDLKTFLESIKSRDGVSYGSSGNGSTNHLVVEKLKAEMGANWTHIPYKGTAPALNDLIGGQTTFMFLDVLTAAPHIKSGRIKALGIAASERSTVLPEVATFSEQGVASFDRGVAFGVLAPKGLPAPQYEVLTRAALKAIDSDKMKNYLATQGVQRGNVATPQQFEAYIDEQINSWGDIVKLANIEPN